MGELARQRDEPLAPVPTVRTVCHACNRSFEVYEQDATDLVRCPHCQSLSMATGEIKHIKVQPDVPSTGPPAIFVVSFVVPLVGYILGIIYAAKGDPNDRRLGVRCLVWATAGMCAAAVVIGFAHGCLTAG